MIPQVTAHQLLMARDQAINQLETLGWEMYGAGVGFGGWDASFMLDRYSTQVSFDGEAEYRLTWYDEDRSWDDNANDDSQSRAFTSFEALLEFAAGLKAMLGDG